jgi:CDGSH iron-sulfur domain-containing protein 3
MYIICFGKYFSTFALNSLKKQTMDKPTVAGNAPIPVTIEAGKTYAWCSCGLSSKQPFCDGSHKPTEFKPHVFTAEETKEVWFCTCKQTANAPFCNGAHKTV